MTPDDQKRLEEIRKDVRADCPCPYCEMGKLLLRLLDEARMGAFDEAAQKKARQARIKPEARKEEL